MNYPKRFQGSLRGDSEFFGGESVAFERIRATQIK